MLKHLIEVLTKSYGVNHLGDTYERGDRNGSFGFQGLFWLHYNQEEYFPQSTLKKHSLPFMWLASTHRCRGKDTIINLIQ